MAGVRGVGLALLVGAVAGCGGESDGYEPAARYPLRADPLVVRTPPVQPTGPTASGRLDEAIARFPSLGGKLIDPQAAGEFQRQQLTQVLEDLFGTPAAPKFACPDRPPVVGGLDLEPGHLAAGSRVYRRLCSQCHGLTGDGRGPTGVWVDPHPRDFRTGVFKVAVGGGKPTVAAITRLVRGGVPGTSMPLFDLIPEEEVRAVVAYVVHLSARGEVEYRVTKALLDEDAGADPGDVAGECREAAVRVFDQWGNAQAKPPPTPASSDDPNASPDQEAVRRGLAVFTGAGGCASCHQDFGRREAFLYDVWGGTTQVPDLTRGEFRWGRLPADLAARVRHGIPASGMPANPQLTDGQINDLTAFVREAGYPQRLPADVRGRLYP